MSMYGIPQQLNLDEINVYKEDTNKQYYVLMLILKRRHKICQMN